MGKRVVSGNRVSTVAKRLVRYKGLLFVLAFAAVGAVLILASRAATPVNGSIEPEDGNLSANVAIIDDPNASGLKAVRFDAPVTGGTVRCGLVNPTFCDTFDAPFAVNSRGGQLDSRIWGVSRATGAVNLGGNSINEWPPTTLKKCDGTTPKVIPPNDVIICNGQLREAVNDNPIGAFDAGTVTTLAMYPKQPFDFAGRTGKVTFDVSNDSQGFHTAWPEFWLSDLPVPTPFNHFDSWEALPKDGFGVSFAAAAPAGQFGYCPTADPTSPRRWTVDRAVASRNYEIEDVNVQGGGYGVKNMRVESLDCVTTPTSFGQMNHVELQISQNQIDVYATDAGTTTPLKHISRITNLNLGITRGLIWLEDIHYNADKGPPELPSQREHTFVWDNVGFDGPFTYKDLSYDALDALVPVGSNGNVSLGKSSAPGQAASWNVLNMPANAISLMNNTQNPVVRVLYNIYCNDNFANRPTRIDVTVNGHAHTQPWVFPDQTYTGAISWKTGAIQIPITDLVTGTNVVTIGTDRATVTSNVNIVLVDVK